MNLYWNEKSNYLFDAFLIKLWKSSYPIFQFYLLGLFAIDLEHKFTYQLLLREFYKTCSIRKVFSPENIFEIFLYLLLVLQLL